MSTDIDDQIRRYMPSAMAQEIKQISKSKINLDIDALDVLNVLNKIIKRGRISNINEREIVLNRIDELSLNQTNSNEVAELNRLLSSCDAS